MMGSSAFRALRIMLLAGLVAIGACLFSTSTAEARYHINRWGGIYGTPYGYGHRHFYGGYGLHGYGVGYGYRAYGLGGYGLGGYGLGGYGLGGYGLGGYGLGGYGLGGYGWGGYGMPYYSYYGGFPSYSAYYYPSYFYPW